MAPELVVRVIGDTSQLEKSFKRAQKATGGLERDLGRTGRGAAAATIGFKGLGRSIAFASGAFLGGAGFAAAAQASVESASNLSEQLSKTTQVFGSSSGAVKDWSETSASAFGLAQDQALAAVSSFGALFAPLKITGDRAAATSERLVQLAGDLSSFSNVPVGDALAAIQSGLVGEAEPLRRFGVLLSEARVQQEALRETGKAHVGQLTDQEKVLARVALIFKDTRKAQGDYTRTSTGLANETKTLKANMRDLGATIGGAVVPPLARLTGAINSIKKGPPVEDSFVPDPLKAALVPKLARDFLKLKDSGKSTADAMKVLRDRLGDSQKGAELLADAIRYTFSEKVRRDIAKLRIEVRGLGTDAEAAAKKTIGVALAAQARAAAVPRGQAALGPGTRLGIALARAGLTPGTGDDMKVLVEQRELFARQIQSLQNRLAKASGAKARDLADQLQQKLTDDSSALGEITSIEQANAQAAADAAAKVKAAAEKRAAAAKKSAEAAKKIAEAITAANKTRLEALAKEIAAGQQYTRSFAALLNTRSRQNATARRTAEQAKVFGLIGLTATGEDRAPSRGNLQAALKKAETAITGSPLDTKAMESRLAGLRNVLNTEFSKLTRDTKIKVGEFLDALAGKQPGGPLTPHNRAVSIKSLVAGTGLTGAGLRQLEFNLAGAHLTSPVRGAIHVHTTNVTNLDGREVARNTTEHQERDQRRRAYQTRGRQHR